MLTPSYLRLDVGSFLPFRGILSPRARDFVDHFTPLYVGTFLSVCPVVSLRSCLARHCSFWSENSPLALRHLGLHHTRLMASMHFVYAPIYFNVPEHTTPCTGFFCPKSLTSVMSSDLRIRLLLHLYLHSPFARASSEVGVCENTCYI